MINIKYTFINKLLNKALVYCFFTFLLTLIISCSNNSTMNFIPFNENEIINHEMKLISTTIVNNYYFNADKTVSVTTGKKDKYLTAPIYQWNIQSDGSLKIYNGNETIAIIKKELLKQNLLCVYENNVQKKYDYK